MASPPPSSRRYRWLVWSLVVGLWTVLLLLPISEHNPLERIPAARREILAKLAHVAGYAALTILAGWLRLPMRWRWLLILFLMGHASVTELLQVPIGRGGSLNDVGWDHLGVLCGVLATWKWWINE